MKNKEIKNAKNKNILVLSGRGKSTLCRFSSEAIYCYGYKEVIKNEDKIKNLRKEHNIIIHLEDDNDWFKLPASIKRIAIAFTINILR